MGQQIFSERFWRYLGNGVCTKHPDCSIGSLLWCLDVMGKASATDLNHQFRIYQATASSNREMSLLCSIFDRMYAHCWIEGRRDDERFIVDGTAGQFNSRYIGGFYGDPAQAKGILGRIYAGRANELTFLSKDSEMIAPRIKSFDAHMHLSER